MAIVRAPLKKDAAGKCSRWRVILYNPATHKQEWHTVSGTRRDAGAFEREQKTRLSKGTYIAKAVRQTFEEVADKFVAECRVRGRRTATLLDYQSLLDCHLMPAGKDGAREGLAPREVGSLNKQHFRDHFARMLEAGVSVQTVNKTLGMAKRVLNYALDSELIERNVLVRFPPYRADRNDPSQPRARRGTFTEAEVRALLAAARPHERALIALLCFTGIRPGEAFALDWSAVDLEAGSMRIVRSWDHRGGKFVEPKTAAGHRSIPLSTFLVAELKAHRERTGGEGLVFTSSAGTPLCPMNVAKRLWRPLRQRAGVPALDMYSLRHTFASLGRTAGESAFNMSRMMGHSRSSLIDKVYAHTLESGLTSAAEAVTARALGLKPQLRVIEGGQNPDIRETLDETPAEAPVKSATT